MDNKKITTTELDFDNIKTNLKTFLQGQSQFSDYDFDGAGLSVLLDILAYNTHYNALYSNLAINEAFLDSASKRSSVVSKAKELGYVPQSAKAATAIVRVTITAPAGSSNVIELPKYTAFSTSVNGITYKFYTTQATLAYLDTNNQYVFDNLELREGTPLSFTYNVVDINSSYIIPNNRVDTSTMVVRVLGSAQASAYTTYTMSNKILSVDGTTAIYYLKENENQLYEIQFGNGIIGKQLSVGNVIVVEYMTCNESDPNGASAFSFEGARANGTTYEVTTLSKAFGGDSAEDIDTIKWNAPRSFASQDRCVTLDDYRAVIMNNFPNAQSVNVWGGELNVPPSYGSVFISVVPADNGVLSDTDKSYILNDIIGPRKIVTVNPVIVDPSNLKIELNVSFYYNPKLTTKTASDLISEVYQTIINYNKIYLGKFGGIFKYSQLSRLIDSADDSIVSNLMTLRVHRPMDVYYNESVQYTVNIANPIYNSGEPEESIITPGFTTLGLQQTCFIDDLPVTGTNTGILRMFYYTGSVKNVIRNVGTVNYATGQITVDGVIVTGVANNDPKFIIKTQSNDVVSTRNQVVLIDPTMIKITPIIDAAPDQYKFTSSRN